MQTAITVRRADHRDAAVLRSLAQLDSAEPPAEPVLIAEAGGVARAALSLVDGSSVADPFHPTADLVELLRVHAAQLAETGRENRLAHVAQALSPRALLRAF
ncbi:MAG: hypothetical protein QOE65_368 [Solirubrobacteraceae bacterium]|jgi:hypothetical protein|nr:hypothetical protein [Solirubrobacteraceae bacterium]